MANCRFPINAERRPRQVRRPASTKNPENYINLESTLPRAQGSNRLPTDYGNCVHAETRAAAYNVFDTGTR